MGGGGDAPAGEAALGRRLEGLELALFLTGELALMNLVLVLRLAQPPARRTLERALARLQSRHPMLRSRVVNDGGSFRFDGSGVSAIPVRMVERKNDSQWRGLVEQELVHGFESVEGPLMRVTLLRRRGGDGPQGEEPEQEPAPGEILLTLPHAIADGPACGEIVMSLLGGCGIVTAPTPDESLPFPQGVEACFPKSFRGARRLRRMSDFIFRQAADEALYRLRTAGRRQELTGGLSPCRILSRQLDESISRGLPRACVQRRVTLNCTLQAAALLAVGRKLHGGRRTPLRFVEFPDLRPYLEPPVAASTVANYSSTTRFTTWVEGTMDLWSLAGEIQSRTHRAYRRGDKFCSAVSSPTMIRTLLRQNSVRMAHTAVSYVGPVLLDSDPGPVQILDAHAFASNFPLGPEYTAQVRWLRGRLSWDIVYLDSDMDEALATEVADEIFDLVSAAVRRRPATQEVVT